MLLPFLLLAGAQLALGQYNANCDGKQVIVQLFEWKWTDIAAECERYLGPAGYCGFQVSPPTEHIDLPNANPANPWWIRYQPVSYKLYSRSGTHDEFVDMVQRCNAVGVRTYVDTIMNHMTGKLAFGVSPYGNSSYDGTTLDYPAVPYTSEHFTSEDLCPSDGDVTDVTDPEDIRNCYLYGLVDLDGSSDYVRTKVSDYLNTLVDIGVAGVRVDAAKHMYPADIYVTLVKVKNLPTEYGFKPNSRLFVYQSIADFNSDAIQATEYLSTGMVTEYRFIRNLGTAILKDYSLLRNLVDYQVNMVPTNQAMVFVDNHDIQRGDPKKYNILNYKNPSSYIQGVAYMLAFDYGFASVMSSYDFTNGDIGPPLNPDGSTADVTINGDGSCGNGWVCEHRWTPIAQMVRFRNEAAGTQVDYYWNTGSAVGFARGNKCYFAMSQTGSLTRLSFTNLPSGVYCNLVDNCATFAYVDQDGNANIVINNPDVPIVAFCVGL